MACPLCATRKGRRLCPAIRQTICPVCCGTKRLVEIRCPSDCSYLAVSRTHPPAVQLRQRERDARFIVPLVHQLPERAYGWLMAFQDAIRTYRGTAIPPLLDADVAEASAALASTLETASRGIIYEHATPSLPAQRLQAELRRGLTTFAREAGTTSATERDAALALRRIEKAAREARAALEASDTAYLDLLARLPYPGAEEAPSDADGGARLSAAVRPDPVPRLIIP